MGVADIDVGYDAETATAGPFSCTLAVTFFAAGASFSPVMVMVTVAVDGAPEPSVTVYWNVSVAVAPAFRLVKAPFGS